MTAEEKSRSDAAWAVVLENQKLVRYFACRFKKSESDMDDLVQAGSIGFYLGVLHFDPSPGRALSTYCQHPIRQHLREEADGRRLVYVPRHAAKLASRVARGKVDESGLSPADARTVALAASAMADMVGYSSEGGDRALRSVPAADDAPPWEHEDVRLAVDSLPPRDRDVIRMRFYEGRLLDDVAATYGISREGARQVEVKALRKLRGVLDPASRGEDVKVGNSRTKYELAPDADLSPLSPRERRAIVMRAREGRTWDQVGAELGVSNSCACRVAKRAMEKLQARKAS